MEASEGILEDSSPPTGHKAEPQVGLYKGYHLLSDLECLKIPLKIAVTKRNAHNRAGSLMSLATLEGVENGGL